MKLLDLSIETLALIESVISRDPYMHAHWVIARELRRKIEECSDAQPVSGQNWDRCVTCGSTVGPAIVSPTTTGTGPECVNTPGKI